MYILLFIVLVVIVVVGYLVVSNSSILPPPPIPPEMYNGDYGSTYARLGSIYDAPLFEPDLLRRCAHGRYMYTDNPRLTAYCDSIPCGVLDRAACGRAFNGRPLHMNYTTPSMACGDCKINCGGRPDPSLRLS